MIPNGQKGNRLFASIPFAFLLLWSAFSCLGQDESKARAVSSSRLTSDENGLTYLKVKTKKKKATGEGWEENVRLVLFTGKAFAEGDSWRAEWEYKEGILDGEVVVVANNKILSRFRYEKGKKILE